MNAPVTIRLHAWELRALLGSVLPLASGDPVIPVLNSVLLEERGGYLTATATDRYVIGMRRIKPEPASSAFPAGFKLLIRAADAKTILRLFTPVKHSEPVADVTITVEPSSSITGLGPCPFTVADHGGFKIADSLTLGFEEEDGDYPPVTKLFVEGLRTITPAPAFRTRLNLRFLSRFEDALNYSDVGSHTGVQLFVADEREAAGPLLVSIGEDFLGGIMPVRGPDEELPAAVTRWAGFLTDTRPADAADKAA